MECRMAMVSLSPPMITSRTTSRRIRCCSSTLSRSSPWARRARNCSRLSARLREVAAAGGGVLGARRLEAAVDLGADELGVLQQAPDLFPHERLELVGADRATGADAPADVPPVVLADAAVVDDLPLRGAGRGAIAGIAALAADDQALQQTRPPGVAPGEAGVHGEALLGEFELLLGDERRDRDRRPRLGGL